MRALVWGLFAFLIVAPQCFAQEMAVTGVRITWYGNYDSGQTVLLQDSGSTTGKRRVSSGIIPPASNSDQILFRRDVRFGFGFELLGDQPNALLNLRYVTKVPAPGIFDLKTRRRKTLIEETYPNLAISQKDLFCGEYLGDYRDPPAGLWTLQVWEDDRLLAEKSFTLSKH
jgi:hypothetical protein